MLGFFSFPPLDLIYTAAYLRKCGYTDVELIDASAKHLYPRDVLRCLKNSHPEFVLIPSTYFTLEDDKYLSSLIRKYLPRTKIIFSGPLVTFDPSIVLADNTADFVALGELELPVSNIIRGDYTENIAYRQNGRIISGSRSLLDLINLPIPARDLIDNHAYRYAIFNRRNPVTPMTISRGCPHSKCEFCHSNLYTLGQIRYRSIGSIIEEINEVVFKYKIGEIFFRDQTFTADRELVLSMCDYIISHNIDILWRASTRVDLVDKQLLEFMRRAGCYQVAFGFESSSQESLDLNNKGITLEQSRSAAKMAKEAGLEVAGLFIVGMLGDSKLSVRSLYNFVSHLDLDYANFKELFVVPGAPFLEKHNIDRKKLLLSKKASKISTIIVYLRFYLRPKYLLKQALKIRSLSDLRFFIRAGFDEFLFHF